MQSSQNQSGTSTQNNVVPAYLQNASQQAVQQGQAIATSTYSPYTGQAIAPTTGNQDQSAALAAQQQAAYAAPGGLSTTATEAFNPTNVGAFVNPNTSGVVNTLGQRIQQQYNPAQVALTSGEAATNNLGSNRAYINQGMLGYQKQNALSDMASAEYGNAVNAGTQAFEAERGQAANEGAQDYTALNATGQAQRATEQNQLNYNYQQFLAQRDWQANHMQPLLTALGASRNDVEQTGTGEGIQSQTNLGSMIGSGAALAGALGTAGGDVSNYANGYTQSAFGPGSNQLNTVTPYSNDLSDVDEGLEDDSGALTALSTD
jgi:hypothetical protein